MSAWKCGHRRSVTIRSLGEMNDEALRYEASLYPNTPGSWGEQVANEVARRRRKCAACEAQARRLRRGWAALALTALLLLLVCWRSCG